MTEQPAKYVYADQTEHTTDTSSTQTATAVAEPFNPAEWITTREAAELTGYTKHTFIKATKNGVLDSIKMGNMRFYKKRDIINYADNMRRLGPQRFTPKIYRNNHSENSKSA